MSRILFEWNKIRRHLHCLQREKMSLLKITQCFGRENRVGGQRMLTSNPANARRGPQGILVEDRLLLCRQGRGFKP